MPKPLPFERVFKEHYQAFAPVARRQRSGLLVVAVDLNRRVLVSMKYMRARPTGPDVAVVGRHPYAAVQLHDSRASLRHLLVVVEPTAPDRRHSEVCFRVIDLRTGVGFGCEHGLQLESVTATGPIALRCADYGIMLLPTGDPTDWPEGAGDAWDLVPPRVFLDERSHGLEAPTPTPVYQTPGKRNRTTQMIAVEGPALLSDPPLFESDDPIRGVLNMAQNQTVVRYEISEAMLARGILVGRYDRCDTGDWLRQPLVSRVHAMVLEVGGLPHLIDLASTNGVLSRPDDESSRIGLSPISSAPAYGIGGRDVTLSWTRKTSDCRKLMKRRSDSSISQH